MTSFSKGPADGKTLMLKRAPLYLRVTDAAGKIDALDQIDDTPAAYEKLYAYELTATPGHCHLNMGGGRGGFYPIAHYSLCDEQPSDEVMRNKAQWQDWCRAQGAKNPLTKPTT